MNERPKHIDLFAGIGGFSLAFEAEGVGTVAYSEINADKCLVYEQWFPGRRNLGDIKTLLGADIRGAYGAIDVVTGGVPCQPASALGKMRGSSDERWLWPETLRVVGEIRPRFGVFENPPSLLVLEGGRAWNGIVSGFCALGYDCWWDVFPAAAFGAGHLRERVLLVVADSRYTTRTKESERERDEVGRKQLSGKLREGKSPTNSQVEQESSEPDQLPGGEQGDEFRSAESAHEGAHGAASHAGRAGLQGHAGNGGDGQGRPGPGRSVAAAGVPDLRGRVAGGDWWHAVNTGVPVLADGLPARLVEAAARCAGDAIVPQVIQPIARAIYECLRQKF